MKILIADDHGVLRDGLRTMIEEDLGYSAVAEAGSGNEAVRLTEQLSPDLVIMDILMPGINGIEATHMIAERCRKTKVIILTMDSSRINIRKSLEAGAKGYLLKEDFFQEIKSAIEAVQRGERYYSKSVRTSAEAAEQELRVNKALNSGFDKLTPREKQICLLLARKYTRKGIAEELSVSPRTVDNIRESIKQKLSLKDRSELNIFVEQVAKMISPQLEQ